MIFTCATFTKKWNFEGTHSGYGDISYYDYLIAFIKSCAINCRPEPLTVYLINTDDMEHLKKLHPRLEINYVKTRKDGDSLKNFAVCYCTKGFKELIKTNKHVAYFDSDIIIRKPVPELFMFPDKGKPVLTVMSRPHQEFAKSKFQAGVILMNKNKKSNYFMEQWDFYTWKALELSDTWFHDQRCLFKVYEVRKSEFVLRPLEYRYNDWNFLDDSPIWHCKGHHDNEKWQAEFNEYHDIAVEELK